MAPRMHRDQQQSLVAVEGTHQRVCHRLGSQISSQVSTNRTVCSRVVKKPASASASVGKRPAGLATSGDIRRLLRSAPRARMAASRLWLTRGTPERSARVICVRRKSSATAICSTHSIADHRPVPGLVAARLSGSPREGIPAGSEFLQDASPLLRLHIGWG